MLKKISMVCFVPLCKITQRNSLTTVRQRVFDGLIKLAKPGSKLVHDGQHPDEVHLGTLPSCAVRVMVVSL